MSAGSGESVLKLREQLARAVWLLGEWAQADIVAGVECFKCGSPYDRGHDPGCPLGQFLEEASDVRVLAAGVACASRRQGLALGSVLHVGS